MAKKFASGENWTKEMDEAVKEVRAYNKSVGLRYVSGIPRKPMPKDTVLVHYRITPQRLLGLNGFRAWTQKLDDTLKVCACSWPGVDLGGLTHYRKKKT